MKTWPVIFSAQMIRALLAGRKTMTRRLPTPMWRAVARHHAVGDECWLWVRETWAVDGPLDEARSRTEDAAPVLPGYGPYYLATEIAPETLRWRHSIHMPRWASRLSLKVDAIGLEQLQDMMSAAAIAEGIAPSANSLTIDCETPDPRDGFVSLWNSLHAKPGTRWEDNPEVYAIRFTPHQRNIDALMRDAA